MLSCARKVCYAICMHDWEHHNKSGVPNSFRPFLWWLRWDAVDVERDRAEIIMAALNHGTVAHLRWIVKTYGVSMIRAELARRLETEFHAGSRNLAKVLFSVPDFRHAR